TLDVAFDDNLVTDCLTGAGAFSAATWQRFCQSRGVPLLGRESRCLSSEWHLTVSIRLLDQVFTGVTDDNLSHFSENVNLLLKNKTLPIINLVGIHMATAVARTHGVDALRNVFGVDAEVFFEVYAAS